MEYLVTMTTHVPDRTPPRLSTTSALARPPGTPPARLSACQPRATGIVTFFSAAPSVTLARSDAERRRS
jgi:hypothetical protein